MLLPYLFRSFVFGLLTASLLATPAHAVNNTRPPQRKPKVLPVVIRPKIPKGNLPQSGFQVTKSGAGKLTLSFFSRDPKLHLDPTGPFVIQFNTLGAFDVEPSVITGTEWPERQKPLTLTLKNVAAGKRYLLAGAAAYNLCGSDPKSCKKVKSEIRYTIQN